jgi:hypothetical protein
MISRFASCESYLAALSAEGRSSATTLLVSSAIRWMNTHASSLPPHSRKLLGFTDNRQDAALQAGHLNDFLFVALLRGAILAAIRRAGPAGLSDDEFGRRVQAALGFTATNRERRQEWMLDPESKGAAQVNAEQSLSRVLAYRASGKTRGVVGALLTPIWRRTMFPWVIWRRRMPHSSMRHRNCDLLNRRQEGLRLSSCSLTCAMDWQSRQTRSIRLRSSQSQMQLDKTCAIPGQYRRRRNRGLLARGVKRYPTSGRGKTHPAPRPRRFAGMIASLGRASCFDWAPLPARAAGSHPHLASGF